MSKRAVTFTLAAWEDYLYWQKADKKLLARINRLIAEITRTPFEGTGKPEALRENYAGFWSRRINDEHRLVYEVLDEQIRIISCRYHYN